MKVCLPTAGEGGLDDVVSAHFGRSVTFTVVDTDSERVQIVTNTSEHMGGTGKPPELIAKTGAQVLICSGLGPMAIEMLGSYGIQVFVGASGTVKEAVKMWKDGQLEPATQQNACKDHHH
jgi:predicted Fe-Mo cluster-binding NifX family protein